MARRGRNGIAGLGKLLDLVPAASVEGVVDAFNRHGPDQIARAWGKPTISPNGRGPYPLVVRVDRAKVSRGTASLTVYGSPAGFWSWAENGVPSHAVRPRRRSTPTGRPPAMAGALSHPISGEVQRGMYPRRAWTETVTAVDLELAQVVVAALDDTLDQAA